MNFAETISHTSVAILMLALCVMHTFANVQHFGDPNFKMETGFYIGRVILVVNAVLYNSFLVVLHNDALWNEQ